MDKGISGPLGEKNIGAPY